MSMTDERRLGAGLPALPCPTPQAVAQTLRAMGKPQSAQVAEDMVALCDAAAAIADRLEAHSSVDSSELFGLTVQARGYKEARGG